MGNTPFRDQQQDALLAEHRSSPAVQGPEEDFPDSLLSDARFPGALGSLDDDDEFKHEDPFHSLNTGSASTVLDLAAVPPQHLRSSPADQRFRQTLNRRSWGAGSPVEVFALCFSFLETEDLARAACVCRSWQEIAQDPTLWRVLDLGARFYRVSDHSLQGMLSSSQFAQLTDLRLDSCSGLTARSLWTIAQCPAAETLETLSLLGCRGLRSAMCQIFTDPQYLPNLKSLELYEAVFAVDVEDLVVRIKAARPDLDLGRMQLVHDALTGTENGEDALCQHADEENPVVGNGPQWCFGAVRGRIVYENLQTKGLGNLPAEVVYSCTNHRELDLRNEDFIRCGTCECFLRRSSAFSDFTCRPCHDHVLLMDSKNWVVLQGSAGASRIQGLSLSDLADRTLDICDRQHLPRRMQSYGSIEVNMDFRMPDAESLEQPLRDRFSLEALQEPERVPLLLFNHTNRTRIDGAVEEGKRKLAQARRARNTRALFCFTDTGDVEVLADQGVMVDGLQGMWQLEIAQAAWEVSSHLLWALLGLLVLVSVFAAYPGWTETAWNGKSDYTYFLELPEDGLDYQLIIWIGVGVTLVVVITIIMFRNNRELCISCLKALYQFNIWVVYAGGLLMALLFTTAELRFNLDVITSLLLVLNWGVLGVYTLYSRHCPAGLHAVAQVALQGTMVLSIAIMLGPSFMPIITTAVVAAEIIAMLRGTEGLFGRELVLASAEDDFIPRILYLVGALRLRFLFFIAYGTLVALSVNTKAVSAVTILAIWSSFAVVQFALPYLGKSMVSNLRAFLVAAAFVYLLWALDSGVVDRLRLHEKGVLEGVVAPLSSAR